MAGHSKWAQIKRKKAVTDQKKGAVFTKIAKKITLAVKMGGPDPEKNFKLRLEIQRAKSLNMPGTNIKRAIEKGTGKAGEEGLREKIYEGYGPGNTAIIVEAVTDNDNRTSTEVRNVLNKNGGRLASGGGVMWLFDRCGVIEVEAMKSLEEVELQVIEMGAVDVEEEDGIIRVIVKFSDFDKIKKELEKEKIKIKDARIEFLPKNRISINKKDLDGLSRLVEAMMRLDDVVEVYVNIE